MAEITYVIECRNMARLFTEVDDYKRKWPPQGYGTSVIRGGVKKVEEDGKEYTQYWVTMSRRNSCD